MFQSYARALLVYELQSENSLPQSAWGRKGRFHCRCNLMLRNKCLRTESPLPPHLSILICFWGLLRMVPSHSLLYFFWWFFLYFTFFISFFDLTRCLWFDLHRHLFLLVLFLLCGCVYNQEKEMQKSTCCHSKYVLFHLCHHLFPTYPSPPCLCLIVPPSSHGFSRRADLLSSLTRLVWVFRS